uniref:CemA family protein n=1 Tax=Cyanothece sp. (strain PCC 7425 / ATCC 29141) TaxID=395961 RepID=B8HPN4_CYAP4
MVRLNAWLNQFQNRALAEAYEAAVAIKSLEDNYFGGNKIETTDQDKAVTEYLQTLLNRQLARVRFNLAQVKVSGFLLNRPSADVEAGQFSLEGQIESQVLEKLAFIESIVGKYRTSAEPEWLPLAAPVSTTEEESEESSSSPSAAIVQATPESPSEIIPVSPRITPKTRNSGSIFDTAAQIRKELSPEYEQEVVRELRSIRKNQTTAIRWLLILLIVPLLVQALTRNIIFEPLLDSYFDANPTAIALNQELAEEFLQEFERFKSSLEVRELLGLVPAAAENGQESGTKEKLKEKATELYREAGYRTLDGWKNLLADLSGLVAFTALVYFGRSKLTTLKTLTTRAFLSLNDPTKIFLLILLTDMFVGFHSVEGWEVILGGVMQHFSLPENDIFVKSFIATVPVIMDACIKFWIFNFLTRSSPSAVAIFEKMNQ